MTQIVPDTGDFATAAVLTIPDVDKGGASWIALLATAVAGDRLLLMIGQDRANHYHYVVTAETVTGASDIQIPVALVEQQGAGTTPGSGDLVTPQLFPRGIGLTSHAGFNMASATAFPDLGAAWQPIDVFDTLYLPGVGMSFDPLDGSWAHDTTGVFAGALQASFNHNNHNAGRTTSVRIFDVTGAAPIGSAFPIGIGRNVEDTTLTLMVFYRVTLGLIGNEVRAEIGGGDAVTAVTFNVASLTFWAISG